MNEQGLFTYLYHWLVVTDQSTLRDIEDIVGNITHFSAISWETQNNDMVRWWFDIDCVSPIINYYLKILSVEPRCQKRVIQLLYS